MSLLTSDDVSILTSDDVSLLTSDYVSLLTSDDVSLLTSDDVSSGALQGADGAWPGVHLGRGQQRPAGARHPGQ